MRAALAIAAIISLSSFPKCFVRADQPTSEQPISWQQPFEAISASKAKDALVLVVITNEDPFLIQESAQAAKERDADGQATGQPPIWCANYLGATYRKALERRPDLRERLILQSIAAGMPKELTGGQARNTPARAVVALCDGEYRLLSLTIGVPDVDDLITLIEDGEEVATIQHLYTDDVQGMVKTIAQRSNGRLSRLWQGALQVTLAMMRGELRPGEGEADIQPFLVERMRLLADQFEPTYLADVKLRFGLIEESDRTRLVLLEQHPEARRPWCEAMIPFVAGYEMEDFWRGLVESVWGHQPITSDFAAKELLDWYDLQSKTGAVVLALRSSLRADLDPWPPVADPTVRRGTNWQEVHALALEQPYREVDPQQLATLMHQRELGVVDIERPSTARYLLLDPKKRAPLVVRQSDPPGRFAGVLKRLPANHAQP